MDIYYLGHSSFRIKSKDAIVITDPFDSKMVGLKFSSQPADIVTVSHQHEDHNNISSVEGARVFTGPGEYEVKGISIIGIPAFHDSKSGTERGQNTIFVFESEGLRVAHLGDLGHELDEKTLEQIGDIDILMVPVGGKYTIDSEKAAQVVRDLEPAICIPMHYAVEELNKSNFEGIESVEKFLSISGFPSEKMDKLSVKKELLGEDTKTIILEKR